MVRKEKQITQLLAEVSLDDSFVLGYYGGGNYGDELLLEVLQHVFYVQKYTGISFLYQKPLGITLFHKDLGYEPIDAAKKLHVLRAVLRRKNLVIGGGGLWGLDVNANVVLMSCLLFFARWFLSKKVYLLGVGYYGSTSPMGHFAAWLAGKSANQILARDDESYERFQKVNPETYLTDDIAFMLPQIKTDISDGLKAFESSVSGVTKPTVMISIRRFKPNQPNSYLESIKTWLSENPHVPVIFLLMEPRGVDPEGFAVLKSLQRTRSNAVVVDFSYNPIVLYQFFVRRRKTLSYIGPQFHVQLVAYLAGVRLLPVFYDNKVSQLLHKLRYDHPIPISKVSSADIDAFVAEERRV